MNAREFRLEIGKAMRRGDQHPIPQVAEAAQEFRSRVFDPLKDEAIRLGLLPDDVKVANAESYLTRVYNREKIIAQEGQWKQILNERFKVNRDHHRATLDGKGKDYDDFANMSDAELGSMVDEVTASILGESAFRLPGLSILFGPKGPLKERVLRVPDEVIEDFLESDIEKVSRIYTNTMAADVELTAKYGDVTMKEQLLKLQEERSARMSKVTSEAQRRKIDNQYNRARADIEALRDRIRGVYKMPDDPNGLMYRAGKLALNANYVTRLGGVTISAIPDISRPIMRYGLNAFRHGWVPFIRSIGGDPAFKLAAYEVRLAGTAIDMIRDTRLTEIADIIDDYGRHSKFERGVQHIADEFGVITGMSPWNGAMKGIAGVVTMAEVLKAVKAVSRGKATKKQINRLAQDGVDEAMAIRIWKQAEPSGNTVNGVFLPNTEAWKDLKAVDAFRAIINREVETLIVTPGLEKPLWMSSPMGRVIGQFKSFAMASTQRTMMAGLQQRDAAALSGVLSALALGALTAQFKASLRNENTANWSEEKWAVEAFDQSGLLVE